MSGLFDNFRRVHVGDAPASGEDAPKSSIEQPPPRSSRRLSTRDAFHAFAHRRSSWFPAHQEETRPKFKWHFYDNDGSYNGWFDWIPLWMRVGYWSPVAVLFLACFYGGMCIRMPRPLNFPLATYDGKQDDDDGRNFWWKMDCFVFLWGMLVLIQAKYSLGRIAAFYISYTGWSWIILTARAFLEAGSIFLSPSYPNAALRMATWGSALRFPAAVAAFVTFTVWNFILLPIMYFKATPTPEKRRGFLKFNFSFFMTNVHILNLPLATINNLYGGSARIFGQSDLWVAYLVVALYSLLYLFVMDRIGLHFYPIFCPRSATCALSFGLVLYLYHYLMQRSNELIIYLNPELGAKVIA
uniref:Uncharacterized protein n=1 Tax=Odontella aurita TaxID=265563 RepID=A0A7S4JF40_9STRA|mmetsp:Transcript_44813/g.136846  ORF Transcript_44813/g.136846 Transcript_44813/m.136846 type:complete len:355 (+) Transcript_44813:194-1258(+)